MVFQAIGFWLLMLCVPLWAYRFSLSSKLTKREYRTFKRLIERADERIFFFAVRLFAFLVVLSAAVIGLISGLSYFKHGTSQMGSYRELVRSRYYSGVDMVDEALDTFHYDQWFPIAVLTTCALLSISFTLVGAALREISILRRLHSRLKHINKT